MDPDRTGVNPESSRTKIRRDVEDELAYHLERKAQEWEKAGLGRDEALRRARESFGDLDRTRRRCRTLQRRKERRAMVREFFDGVRHDLRFALRQLRRSPGFTAVAVLTLAIGIGANSAMFSIVRGVLLRPLPYPDSHELVRVWGTRDDGSRTRSTVSPQDFLDWQDRAESFDGIAVFTPTDLSVESPDGPVRVAAAVVSNGTFRTLDVEPLLGRGFTPEEDTPGGPAVAILSHAFWSARFRGEPDVIGSTLHIGEQPHTIVGVLPAGAGIPSLSDLDQPRIYLPVAIGPENGRGGRWLRAFARLRDGVPIESAQAEMDAISAELEREYPNSNTGHGVWLESLLDAEVGNARSTLVLLVGAVGLILLIACVNIANLMLARGATRAGELGVRMTLGASRRRLLRQIGTEGMVLAGLGAGLGLWIAFAVTRLVQGGLIAGIPRASAVTVDPAVLAFTGAIALAATAFFSVLPFGVHLRERTIGAGPAARGVRRRYGQILVAAELALALPLVVSAGTMLRSFNTLMSVDAGVDLSSTVAIEVVLPEIRFGSWQEKEAFYRELTQALDRAPEVSAVGGVNNIPFLYDSCDGFQLPDRPDPPAGERPCASNQLVTPGYFAAMGTPMIEGREFTHADHAQASPVIVVNDVMAETFWPGRSALGQIVAYNGIRREIIGVSRAVRRHGLASDATSEMFIPHAQEAWDGAMFMLVRSDRTPEEATALVRGVVGQLDDATPARFLAEMPTLVSNTVAAPRTRTILVGFFSLVGLVLAVVGVHGVMAFAVTQRSREIGVRTALGATAPDVRRMVLGDALRIASIGLAMGTLLSIAASRVLESFLFETPPLDPLTLGGALLLLFLGALVAGEGPARRASRGSPADVIRADP